MKRWRVGGVPSDEILDELAAILSTGGVALLPTDTIYGLHAVAANANAVARIAAMKERPGDKAFVVIAASIEQLERMGVIVPDVLRTIWPAPLTAILASGETTIAARVPDLAWLRALLARTGPLVSTSANRSGEPPVTSPEKLGERLQERLDALLDQGSCEGKASTIVSFTGSAPEMVREGDATFSQFLRKSLWKEV
ncbi:MAG: L-threonylcarbamoyladenylate synthase [Thermoanaerobaculia bacterium]|jgi:tRNA threonylcarbamoyl adenosine modification protein (Sua5/YciO/YrdC/YwlC family)|nr:L-threonylcarbamoyladenylate synthase [Thermoanaerobaculia bacterium]